MNPSEANVNKTYELSVLLRDNGIPRRYKLYDLKVTVKD